MNMSEDIHTSLHIYHNSLMTRLPSENAVLHGIEVFRDGGGTLRTREAAGHGIHYSTLYGMRDAGLLEQMSRGVYRLAELPAPSRYDILAVATRVPGATFCLASALDFHEIGTQIPAAVNIAIGSSDRQPRIDFPPVRVYRMSGRSLTAGVEEHSVDGTDVRVFCIAKTVADCFKFRNKIGLDVAIEALKETVRRRKATPAEIMEFAEIDRVSNVVRPYLEVLQ